MAKQGRGKTEKAKFFFWWWDRQRNSIVTKENMVRNPIHHHDHQHQHHHLSRAVNRSSSWLAGCWSPHPFVLSSSSFPSPQSRPIGSTPRGFCFWDTTKQTTTTKPSQAVVKQVLSISLHGHFVSKQPKLLNNIAVTLFFFASKYKYRKPIPYLQKTIPRSTSSPSPSTGLEYCILNSCVGYS